MTSLAIGLLIVCGAGLSAMIGAATAIIQNIERKIREGSGRISDLKEVKRLRAARAWAGVGVMISLGVLLTMLLAN